MQTGNDALRCRRRTLCTRVFRTLGYAALAVVIIALAGPSYASSPGFGVLPVTAQVLTSIAASSAGGFWVQLQDVRPSSYQPRLDGTYSIDGAYPYDNFMSPGNIVTAPLTNGYWIVTAHGQIIGLGPVPELCDGELSNCSGFPTDPNSEQIIVGVAATPSGQGLWAVSRDGSLWTAGDARPYGDVRNQPPVTGIVATLGSGYYIVCSDGGVFSFGDAVFHGSTGGQRPGGHNITGIATSVNANSQIDGYWLVADDGGVYTFGKAPFWGSTGGNDGGSPVISITSYPRASQTQGYAWVHADGRVESVSRPIATTVPTLKAKPEALKFPSGSLGVQSSAKNLTLINEAEQTGIPITLSGFSLTSNVAVVPGGTCVEGEVLGPQKTCTLALTMTPSATGANHGSVEIMNSGDDGNLTVNTSINGKASN